MLLVYQCSAENVLKFFDTMHEAIYTIESISKSETISKPSSPYITSTIQQDLNSKLGISPKKTMQILQKLYEHGKITYMRTDSKIISQDCMDSIKDTINNLYGDDYYKCRIYKNNSKNAQEAHECIRPVHIDEQEICDEFTAIERKVYSHIWKRTVACQMEDKRGEKYTIKIKNSVNELVFYTELEKTTFLGYSILYDSNKIDETAEKDQGKKKNILGQVGSMLGGACGTGYGSETFCKRMGCVAGAASLYVGGPLVLAGKAMKLGVKTMKTAAFLTKNVGKAAFAAVKFPLTVAKGGKKVWKSIKAPEKFKKVATQMRILKPCKKETAFSFVSSFSKPASGKFSSSLISKFS